MTGVMLEELVEGGVGDEVERGEEESGENGRSGKRALERVVVEDSEMVVDTSVDEGEEFEEEEVVKGSVVEKGSE